MINDWKILLLLLTNSFFLTVGAQQTLPDIFFHPDTLKTLVQLIASDSMEGRFTGTKGCLKAPNFIADQFEQAGILPVSGNDKFLMPVTENWVNVVGALNGKSNPQQLLIFCAHYDHIGTIYNEVYGLSKKPTGSSSDWVYNGANDNASGVAAVISMAKYFASTHENKRTILFVAFAGEELGLLGSKDFASQFEPDSIVAVINIEMIGRKYTKSSRPFVTGSRHSDLIRILNQRLFEADSEKYRNNFFQPDGSALFDRSDNYSFAARGIPAHSIKATADNDPYYHTVDDEVSTLDFKFMSEVIHAIALSSEGLINGQDTPTRIK